MCAPLGLGVRESRLEPSTTRRVRRHGQQVLFLVVAFVGGNDMLRTTQVPAVAMIVAMALSPGFNPVGTLRIPLRLLLRLRLFSNKRLQKHSTRITMAMEKKEAKAVWNKKKNWQPICSNIYRVVQEDRLAWFHHRTWPSCPQRNQYRMYIQVFI